MPSPAKPTVTATEDDAPERLAEWRAERARIAETARQKRLAAFEADRARRVEEAQEQRQAKAAEKDATRLNTARGRIDTVEDLDTARRRLQAAAAAARRRAMARIACLVILPTVLAAWYYANVATPLFEAQATFAIGTTASQPDGAAQGGLFAPAATRGTARDAFVTEAFITSPELMRRMEDGHGYLAHFGGARLGLWQEFRTMVGLPPSPRAIYRDHVRATVDTQSGLLTLAVDARTPAEAEAYARIVADYAQSHVNTLAADNSRRQVATLEAEVTIAHDSLAEARRRLVDLKLQSGEPDPEARSAAVYAIIADLERQLAERQRTLAGFVATRGGNGPVAASHREEIARIEEAIASQRMLLTGGDGQPGLTRILAAQDYARIDVDLAQKAWEAKLTALETLRQSLAGRSVGFAAVAEPSADPDQRLPDPIGGTALIFVTLVVGYVLFSVFGAGALRHAPA